MIEDILFYLIVGGTILLFIGGWVATEQIRKSCGNCSKQRRDRYKFERRMQRLREQ